MASRSAVRRQLSEVMASGKWRLLDFRERGIWLHLHAEAVGAAEPGRIEFLGAFLPDLARVVSLAEDEVEEAVGILQDVQLLEVEEGGMAAWLPGLRVSTDRRTAANRENGKKGGRPRKVTPQNDPRQTNQLHPIPGGRETQSETQSETHRETQSETHGGRPVGFSPTLSKDDEEERLLANTDQISSSSSSYPVRVGALETQPETHGETQPETHALLAAEVSRFIGSNRAEPHVLRGWFEQGATVADVKDGMERLQKSGRRPEVIQSAVYLTPWVMGPVAARAANQPRNSSAPAEERAKIEAVAQWGEALRRHYAEGTPHPGPRPGTVAKAA